MKAATNNPQQPSTRQRRSLLLWLGVLGGPIAWATQLIVGYGFVTYACDHASKMPLYALAVVTAVLTIAAGYLAWTTWQLASGRRWMDMDEPNDHWSFMGTMGVLMSLIFLLLIGMTGAAAVFANACPLITLKMP